VYQTIAHNGTVTIADPPQSIFDPQAWFLYIILASGLSAVAYFVYSTYDPLSPFTPPALPQLVPISLSHHNASPSLPFFSPFVATFDPSYYYSCVYLQFSWIKTVLPKKKSSRSKDTRKREPATATASGASNYEEWIPQHHLKKDNTPAKKRKGGNKVSSPGSQSN
jgi:hypothetical protein